MTIKTFIRLDTELLKMFGPLVNTTVVAKGHCIVATLKHTANDRADVLAWLAAQPNDCYAHVEVPTRGGSRIEIGFSLSKLEYGELVKMTNSRNFSIIQHSRSVYTGMKLTPTGNPLLSTAEGSDYLYLIPHEDAPIEEVAAQLPVEIPPETMAIVTKLSATEQEFIDSLKGHDFFYAYSDSLSVFKAGKADEDRLIAAGVAMGLSETRVQHLYRAEYKRLAG